MIEKRLNNFDEVQIIIDSIFLLINGDIRQEPPQINDKQTQDKINSIYDRIKDNEKYCDNVYAYFFVEQKSIYVGRTLHLKLRDSQHRLNEDSAVFRFAHKHGIEIPPMTILERFKTIDEGVEKENYYCIKYEKEGWNLLNVAPTGEKTNTIGTYNSEKWDYKKCYIEAQKYKTVKDFKSNSHKAYNASVRHGFLKHFDWLEGRLLNTRKRLSYEDCKAVALKYETLKDFMKYDRKVYRFSKDRDWVRDFYWLKREKDHAKPVEQYSLDGNLLNTYKSVNEASNATSIPYWKIYSCCNGKKVRGIEFMWKYKN